MARKKWNPESLVREGENPNGMTSAGVFGVNVDCENDQDGERNGAWGRGVDGERWNTNPLEPEIDPAMAPQPPRPARRRK